MKYLPNFNDPRVRNRILKAYTYAKANLDFDEESPHSKEALSKRFGQQQTPISQWLRDQLLICTDHHYSEAASLSKKYTLNKDGVAYIENILQLKHTKAEAIHTYYQEEYKDELATGNFTLNESSNRLWHPIQSVKTTHRRELFYKNGYNHEYDIQCCSPTLLYQEALKHGLTPQPIIEAYLKDRTSIRVMLASQLNSTPEKVKKIINALFGGAKVGTSEYHKLFRDLDSDRALIRAIQKNDYLNLLRESISKMWKALPIKDRRKGKEKMALYFELEHRVLKAIMSFLKKNNNKHFPEHDGWFCEYQLDEYQLKKHVYDSTGFDISVEHISLRDICENNERDDCENNERDVLTSKELFEKYNI